MVNCFYDIITKVQDGEPINLGLKICLYYSLETLKFDHWCFVSNVSFKRKSVKLFPYSFHCTLQYHYREKVVCYQELQAQIHFSCLYQINLQDMFFFNLAYSSLFLHFTLLYYINSFLLLSLINVKPLSRYLIRFINVLSILHLDCPNYVHIFTSFL